MRALKSLLFQSSLYIASIISTPTYYSDFDGLDSRTERYQSVKKAWGTTFRANQ